MTSDLRGWVMVMKATLTPKRASSSRTSIW